MSAFRFPRGGGGQTATDEPEEDERRRALARELRTPGHQSKPAGQPEKTRELRRALSASSDALASLLRSVRVGVGDVDMRREIESIEDGVGKALVPRDFEEVLEKVRGLRIGKIAKHGALEPSALALALFHRVTLGLKPLAQALDVNGAKEDLAQLMLTSALDSLDAREIRILLRTLETFALNASRRRESATLMKSTVAELVETIGKLGGSEIDHRERLSEIRQRLIDANDPEDLERLRSLLINHTQTLVDAAANRADYMHEAVASAQASQARAEALEAALTDAEEEARTDALTGLGNRRALADALRRHSERGKDVGLLALDLDHFKAINDRHGHAGGDIVLRHVADLLRGEIRGDDEAFRVGGEEMLVLLPEADWQGARATAERLRSRLERERVNLGGGELIEVTMSLGVFLWRGDQRFEEALLAADKALYRAKESGRNRVVG